MSKIGPLCFVPLGASFKTCYSTFLIWFHLKYNFQPSKYHKYFAINKRHRDSLHSLEACTWPHRLMGKANLFVSQFLGHIFYAIFLIGFVVISVWIVLATQIWLSFIPLNVCQMFITWISLSIEPVTNKIFYSSHLLPSRKWNVRSILKTQTDKVRPA